MTKYKILLLIILVLCSVQAAAAYKDLNNAKVQLISVWTNNGNLLVQTNPRPDVSDMACTTDYWLTVNKTDPGYQTVLAMLLSSQTASKALTVRFDDSFGEYCKIIRVITNP